VSFEVFMVARPRVQVFWSVMLHLWVKWFSMLQRRIVPSLSMVEGPFLHGPLTWGYSITSQETRIGSLLKIV
jgi:hypothetical protein